MIHILAIVGGFWLVGHILTLLFVIWAENNIKKDAEQKKLVQPQSDREWLLSDDNGLSEETQKIIKQHLDNR